MEVEESPNYLYTNLTVKKIDTVFRRSILPHLQIKFNFFFKFKTFFCIEPHDFSTSHCNAYAAVTVRKRPVSYDAIRKAVGRAVTALPNQQYRHDLIEMACLKVGSLLCTGKIPTYTNLLVQFHTRVERLRYGDGSDDGGDGIGMVPAAESAVGVLEKVHVEARSACTCCICLEEFGDGVVLRMPCLHAFHGGCIDKWLRTSHYCPVCRYEMPTE